MNIAKNADSQVPNWMFDPKTGLKVSSSKYVMAEEISRIKSLPDIIDEKDRIEACSVNGDLYHYSSKWGSKERSELKEYAMVCGMDMTKFRSIDPDSVSTSVTANTKKDMIKTASYDPFHLDEVVDKKTSSRDEWEKISGAKTVNNIPSLGGGSVIAVRGGGTIYDHSVPDLAKNQNSISNPNAIKTLAENKDEDICERLRKDRSNWEKDISSKIKVPDAISQKKVFQTEVAHVQSGIRAKAEIPEQTRGEMLKEMGNKNREEIQRQAKEKREFIPRGSSLNMISDDLSSELAKYLGK